MRIRQILLVHPTRSIRALIKKYVYAELNDIAFQEADSGEDALAELTLNDFDVVLISTLMKDMPAGELKARMGTTDHNPHTPCVVLCEEDNGSDRDELARQGFDQVVMMRRKPAALIAAIDAVCDPRKWRKDRRYYLPDAEASVYVQGQSIDGALINISLGGVLMELVAFEPHLLMRSGMALTIYPPEGRAPVDGLPCKLLRIDATEWHPDNSPAAMRATFVFTDLTGEQSEALQGLLRLAVEDNAEE